MRSGGRRSIRRAVVLLVGLLLGMSAAGAARADGTDGGGLRPVASSKVSARVQALTFRPSTLPEAAHVNVLLPSHFDRSGRTRYPVLYLLHGAAGDAGSWLASGDVERSTAGLPLIVVMPDAGYFGFYADWWSYGAGGGPAWETFHLEQLLPWVDAHYPTIASRDGRAVAGLSMGGLGALHYAAKRPDLFTAAASFSGAIDTNLLVAPPIVEVAAMAHGTHLPSAVFGPRLTEEIRWRGHNPVDLAENLRGLFLTLDVGTGEVGQGPADVVEGAMHEMAVTMHDALTSLRIPHTWDDYGPGCHCWPFWQRDLRELLPPLMQRFAHPSAVPSPFSYRSIDAAYDVYGWRVAIDRPAVELSRLSGAGPRGFTLTGSGAARVRTGPTFAPGQVVRVTTTDAAGTHVADCVADRRGRLTVPVSLGPANPLQQLSPLGNVWALAQGAPLGTWPSVTARVTFAPAPPG